MPSRPSPSVIIKQKQLCQQQFLAVEPSVLAGIQSAWIQGVHRLQLAKSQWDIEQQLKSLQRVLLQDFHAPDQLVVPLLLEMLELTRYLENLLQLKVSFDHRLAHLYALNVHMRKTIHSTFFWPAVWMKLRFQLPEFAELNQALLHFTDRVQQMHVMIVEQKGTTEAIQQQLLQIKAQQQHILEQSGISEAQMVIYRQRRRLYDHVAKLGALLRQQCPWITLKQHVRYGCSVGLFIVQILLMVFGLASFSSGTLNGWLHFNTSLVFLDSGFFLVDEVGMNFLETYHINQSNMLSSFSVLALLLVMIARFVCPTLWGWLAPVSLALILGRLIGYSPLFARAR